MSNSAIQRAAKAAGSQSALARALGCKPQAVQRWCRTGVVPAERVLDIERITSGAVTRHELRPDLYPDESPHASNESSVPPTADAVSMKKAS